MNQHSNNRPQQEKKPTTFSTPEKQQRYRQLWQRASTAAEVGEDEDAAKAVSTALIVRWKVYSFSPLPKNSRDRGPSRQSF